LWGCKINKNVITNLSAIAALCPKTAIGWPPWMVALVGTGRRRGAGTLAGVESARRGLAPSIVVPRMEQRTTTPNAATEERRLHVVVPRNDAVQENTWDSCRGHGVRPESHSRETLRGVPGCPPVVLPEGGCCRSLCPKSEHGSLPSRRLVVWVNPLRRNYGEGTTCLTLRWSPGVKIDPSTMFVPTELFPSRGKEERCADNVWRVECQSTRTERK